MKRQDEQEESMEMCSQLCRILYFVFFFAVRDQSELLGKSMKSFLDNCKKCIYMKLVVVTLVPRSLP